MKYFHPEELALLAAIHAAPREDTPRLVYADWLQEHGQEEYAEFIRLSLNPAQNKPGPGCRITELSNAFGQKWSSPKPRGLHWGCYRRGLPTLYLEPSHVSPERHAGLTSKMSPRIRLILNLHDDDLLAEWCTSPLMTRVSIIQFNHDFGAGVREITAAGIERLAAAKSIARIEMVRMCSRLTEFAKNACYEMLKPLVPIEPYGGP